MEKKEKTFENTGKLFEIIFENILKKTKKIQKKSRKNWIFFEIIFEIMLKKSWKIFKNKFSKNKKIVQKIQNFSLKRRFCAPTHAGM